MKLAFQLPAKISPASEEKRAFLDTKYSFTPMLFMNTSQ